MAVSDADYRFLHIDVGGYGSEGDSTAFRDSEFGKSLAQNKLNLPPGAEIAGKFTPYYFIGDDAFPLDKRMMKPYSPRNRESLTQTQRVFNYRSYF